MAMTADTLHGPPLLDAVSTVENLQEFSRYRSDLNRTIRPLAPIAEYPARAGTVTQESLRHWHASPGFAVISQYFADYPERSLCRACDRALLYHLVRTIRPQHAVEIGSYFTASTEVMARALWENGEGIVHTIDPFGKLRVPALLSQWDARLRAHVEFHPWFSMQFFQHCCDRNLPLDLVFVDGNHDFEYALFDLLSAARLTRPGGIVVMDDINQSGPFWAAKLFLQQFPGWHELGHALSVAESDDPLGPVPTVVPESKFLILQAPHDVVVGPIPFSTGQVAYEGNRVQNLDFSLEPGQSGKLFGRVFLRSFAADRRPEQIEGRFQFRCDGGSQQTARLADALQTSRGGSEPDARQTVETVVLWRPDEAGQPLRMQNAPHITGNDRS